MFWNTIQQFSVLSLSLAILTVSRWAAEARWLQPAERIIGVTIGGEHRAYPLKILNWHEVVNDTVGGQPIVIAHCPVCDSAVVFGREVEGQVLEFGKTPCLARHPVWQDTLGGRTLQFKTDPQTGDMATGDLGLLTT